MRSESPGDFVSKGPLHILLANALLLGPLAACDIIAQTSDAFVASI
jgi:hypothetical protein